MERAGTKYKDHDYQKCQIAHTYIHSYFQIRQYDISRTERFPIIKWYACTGQQQNLALVLLSSLVAFGTFMSIMLIEFLFDWSYRNQKKPICILMLMDVS